MSFRELFHPVLRTGKKKEVSDLRSHFDSLFDNFFGDWSKDFSMIKDSGFKEFSPSVNFIEGENEYTLEAEVPGMDKENISVELHGDSLILSGTKKEESTEKKEKVHRREFSYGSFKRVFTLPVDVDRDSVKAYFEKGVLKVKLMKKPELVSDKKKVPVN